MILRHSSLVLGLGVCHDRVFAYWHSASLAGRGGITIIATAPPILKKKKKRSVQQHEGDLWGIAKVLLKSCQELGCRKEVARMGLQVLATLLLNIVNRLREDAAGAIAKRSGVKFREKYSHIGGLQAPFPNINRHAVAVDGIASGCADAVAASTGWPSISCADMLGQSLWVSVRKFSRTSTNIPDLGRRPSGA